MKKLEPYTEAEIKELYTQVTQRSYPPPEKLLRMILTWAEAKGRVEYSTWLINRNTYSKNILINEVRHPNPHYGWSDDNKWVAAVLKRIGWENEQT